MAKTTEQILKELEERQAFIAANPGICTDNYLWWLPEYFTEEEKWSLGYLSSEEINQYVDEKEKQIKAKSQ